MGALLQGTLEATASAAVTKSDWDVKDDDGLEGTAWDEADGEGIEWDEADGDKAPDEADPDVEDRGEEDPAEEDIDPDEPDFDGEIWPAGVVLEANVFSDFPVGLSGTASGLVASAIHFLIRASFCGIIQDSLAKISSNLEDKAS